MEMVTSRFFMGVFYERNQNGRRGCLLVTSSHSVMILGSGLPEIPGFPGGLALFSPGFLT